MKKTTVFALLGLLGLLQYQIWFDETGLPAMWRMQHQVSELQARNNTLAGKNKLLTVDINALKSGDDALIERARTDMGMVQQGETYYQFVGS